MNRGSLLAAVLLLLVIRRETALERFELPEFREAIRLGPGDCALPVNVKTDKGMVRIFLPWAGVHA